jgi:hypothetical protein
MGRSRATWLVLAVATLHATAAEPVGPSAAGGPAPSAELLEYLGTWNGDEEWLHTEELLPAPTRKPGVDSGRAQLERANRADAIVPTEQ